MSKNFQERVRRCRRKPVKVTKCDVGKTLKHYLVSEHSCLSHIDMF